MAISGPTVQIWDLEKYARFIEGQTIAFPLSKGEEADNNKASGKWEYYDNKGGRKNLQICLKEPKNLIIYDNSKIMESFSLHGTSNWLRCVCKGDSILFLYKVLDKTRRFRVKFAKSNGIQGGEHCASFSKVIGRYTEIKTLLSGNSDSMQIDLSQTIDGCEKQLSDQQKQCPSEDPGASMPLAALASAVLNKTSIGQRDIYKTTNTPTQNVPDIIQTCLLDQNFPGFVDVVEKTLNELTAGAKLY